MTSRTERGTTTAEYAVGTLGACTMALVLHRLGTDGYWLDLIRQAIREALQWRNIFHGVTRYPLRIL